MSFLFFKKISNWIFFASKKKDGLREFSTFVSKMVKQKFGSSYLALTRINELDRYTMQRIKGNFSCSHLPYGIKFF
jgi:hypothetical protein